MAATAPMFRIGLSRPFLNLCSPCRNALTKPSNRFFSSFVAQRSSAAAPRTANKAPLPTLNPPTQSEKQAELVRRFARLSEPLVLYKNTRVKSYLLGVYSLTAFCFGYAGFCAYSANLDPEVESLKIWVGKTLQGVSVLIVAAGAFFYLRGSRLVTKITAIPNPKRVQLRFDVRRNIPLPWIKPKSMDVSMSDVVFPEQVVTSSVRWKFIEGSTARAGPIAYILLVGRCFYQADIALLKIKGKKGVWKVDTLGSFPEKNGLHLFVWDEKPRH